MPMKCNRMDTGKASGGLIVLNSYVAFFCDPRLILSVFDYIRNTWSNI